MRVSDCISTYHTLSAEIFDEAWRPKAWKLAKATLGLTGSNNAARSKRLRMVVCRIIEQYLPSEEKLCWTKPGEQFDAEKVPLHNKGANHCKSCHVYDLISQEAHSVPGYLTVV